MKDIKIRIENTAYNLAIIDHAGKLGYKADEANAMFLLDADYLILDPNQNIRWCESDLFRMLDSYEEMSDVEFLKYGGEE